MNRVNWGFMISFFYHITFFFNSIVTDNPWFLLLFSLFYVFQIWQYILQIRLKHLLWNAFSLFITVSRIHSSQTFSSPIKVNWLHRVITIVLLFIEFIYWRWERPPPTYDEALKHFNPDTGHRPPDPPPYSDRFRPR